MAKKITGMQVRRFNLPRADPAWRTSIYAGTAVEGFVLELTANGTVGIGGSAAHPLVISGDDVEAQLNGPVHDILIGADVYDGSGIRQELKAAKVHSRASIAADLALYDLLGKIALFITADMIGRALGGGNGGMSHEVA